MKRIIVISMGMLTSILPVNVVSAPDGLVWQRHYYKATALNRGTYGFGVYTLMGRNT